MAQRDEIKVRLSAEGQAEIIRALRAVNTEASAANRATVGLFREIKSILPTLGFGAVVTGFAALVQSAARFEDALAKGAQRSNVAVEDFSAIAFGASTADASLQDVEASLGALARNLSRFKSGSGEAVESLRALGLSAADFANVGVAEAFELVSKRIASLPPGLDRARIAQDLLGEGGRKLLPLMSDVANKGLAQMRAEAEAFGVLVTGETSQAAQAFNDDLTRLSASSKKLGRDLVRDALPGLAEVTRAMSEAAKESGILRAAWAGLGGVAALALGRTESQQLARLADEIKTTEQRIATLRERLADGPLVLPFIGEINRGGLDRLRTDIERDVQLLDTLRQRLADLRKPQPAAKPTEDDGAAIGFDARRRIAELEKQIGADQLKTIEDIAKRRQQIASEELANVERLATARTTNEQQATAITLDGIRQRQALLRQGFESEIRGAQVREQALSEAAARSTARGRTLADLQRAIAKESLDGQLRAAQSYYGALAKLNADYLQQYTAAQGRIKALDDELQASRQQNERDIADARRAGLSEAQRAAEDFRRLEQLRADFGSAVVRNAGTEARALKQQFDEIARGLRAVEGFESAVGRVDAEVQSLFSTLISTEKAREQALGREAAAGVRATNEELGKTKSLTADLSKQQLAEIQPTVDQAGLRELRGLVEKALLASPFRINVAPQIQGSGTPAFASGGMVGGSAPHPRADNVLARVTSGEFVHQVAAVRHYGINFMRDVNAMRLPRFADGGLVGDLASASNDPQHDVVDVNLNVGGRTIRLQSEREQAHALVRALESVSGGR